MLSGTFLYYCIFCLLYHGLLIQKNVKMLNYDWSSSFRNSSIDQGWVLSYVQRKRNLVCDCQLPYKFHSTLIWRAVLLHFTLVLYTNW